jgi:DNA-binding NtrC family response regulator
MSTDTVRILFIDDEELVLNSLRRALRNETFGSFFTTEPETAFRLVKEENIDIVVSDQSMPNMSGTEFLAILRRLHEKVIRVMLTGQSDRETTINAINDGHVHRFLDKPWDNDKLRTVLQELVLEVRLRRQAERRAAMPSEPRRALRTVVRDATGAVVISENEV